MDAHPLKARSSAPTATADVWGDSVMGLQQGGSLVELQTLMSSSGHSKDGPDSFPSHPSSSAPPTTASSLAAAGLYGGVGLGMGFANKAVLQQWPYSNTLLTFQMATSLLLIATLSSLSLISVRRVDLRGARTLFPLAFFYNANVAFALAAVRALSIPVYHVMKRLTPLIILVIKFVMGDGMPPTQITMSVLVVVAGCILSGMGDLSFDGLGYLMAIISCLLQATYLILVERSGTEKGYTSNELLLYNALMSLPILTLLVLSTGELNAAINAYHSPTGNLRTGGPLGLNFLWLLGLSLLMGSLLNYSLFLCTITNSALGTTIVGIFRSIVGTFLGFFVLGGIKLTPLIVTGVTVNSVGGVWYTIAKHNQKPAKHSMSPKADALIPR